MFVSPPLVLLLLSVCVCVSSSVRIPPVVGTFLLFYSRPSLAVVKGKSFCLMDWFFLRRGLCPREMRWIINREDGKAIPLLSDGCWDGRGGGWMLQLISYLRQFSELIPPFLFWPVFIEG